MKTKTQRHPCASAEHKARIDAIVRPLSTANYEVDVSWFHIERQLADLSTDYGLNLVPDFQRGHVWTSAQQQAFIENVLRGVVPTSGLLVAFNCPHWDDSTYQGDLPREVQCVDGLQRLTAIRAFLASEIRPFGLDLADLEGTDFDVKRIGFRVRMAVHTFQSRAELLQHYLDINAGGTPHSEAEITRVRELHRQAAA
ncbi:MAG: DUF262 domain-containing protein [Pseudomonas sp.]